MAWLYRILSAVADDTFLAGVLRFKGGTCAAMQGFIQRFSVDLDFDLVETDQKNLVETHLEKIFKKLGLEIKDQSSAAPQYFLKYKSHDSERNTIRIDVTFPATATNKYEPVRFVEIDRILFCQTIETMFANKLVAVLDRYEKHHSITGRDLFDLQTFFLKGYGINENVIEERRGKSLKEFLPELIEFIETKITQRLIDEDLNHLLPPETFKKIRKLIKQEVLMGLKSRIAV